MGLRREGGALISLVGALGWREGGKGGRAGWADLALILGAEASCSEDSEPSAYDSVSVRGAD